MNDMCKVMMGAGLCWVASASIAGELVRFDVQPQPLHAALDAWAAQTGLQFVVPSALLDRSSSSPGVVGEVTPARALDLVLTNSTLDYEFINAHTVSLRDGLAANPSAGAATLANASAFMLAAAVAPTSPATDPLRMELDEIVVTGTRLRNVENATPTIIIDRQRIDELGATSVADVLRYVPQQAYTMDEAFSSAQHAQLRGLGFDTTLVLINGRRTVPSAGSVAFNAFDLNAIPLAAVERVEVLSESASAVYGADAIGGVVNIVLKDQIERPSVELHYGSARDGGRERRVSFAAGRSGERLSTAFTLDAMDRSELLGSDRERTSNDDMRRYGGEDWRFTASNPSTIYSLDGENLPGLDASFAAAPAGSGVGLLPSDLRAGESNASSTTRYSSLLPELERRNATLTARYELSDQQHVFVEAMYGDAHVVTKGLPPYLFGVVVPAANPFNPFGVDVAADYLFTDLGGREYDADQKHWRAVSGLSGTFGAWDSELSALYSHSNSRTSLETLDSARIDAALANTDPAQSLNLFGSGVPASASLLASLSGAPTVTHAESNGALMSGFVRGALWQLPSGALEVVVGAEGHREVALSEGADLGRQTRDALAGFAEMQVPLVIPAWDWPLVHRLGVSLAARYDEYSDFGSTFNPKVGLTWSLTQDVMLRGSWSTSFRPPSLYELYAPRDLFELQVVDTRRGNEQIGVSAVAGGNPDLEPIEGESVSAGVLWTPSTHPQARVSLGYWRVLMDQRVGAFNTTLLINNEDEFPSRVVRAPASPADLALGQPGRLTLLDISRINYGSIKTDGVDVELSYLIETPLGVFTPTLAGTYVHRYEVVNLPDTPVSDRVGVASGYGTIPEWRAVAGLAWKRTSFGASINVRYAPAYEDIDPIFETPTGREVSALTLVDVQASVDVGTAFGNGAEWISALRLTFGALNVFDRQSPFSASGFGLGIDSSQGELRQRFVYANLSKGF